MIHHLQISRRAALGIVLASTLAITIGGCSFSRPSPVKETYLVSPKLPAALAAPTQKASLRIGSLRIASTFRDRNFVSRESDLRFENDYYHEFLTPPSAMLSEALSQALTRANVFAHTAAPDLPVQADYVLDGFVSELYADNRVRGPCVATFAVAFYLSRADIGSGVPFWSKEYRSETRCRDDSADAYVAALSTGLSDVFAKLAQDLSEAKLPAQ